MKIKIDKKIIKIIILFKALLLQKYNFIFNQKESFISEKQKESTKMKNKKEDIDIFGLKNTPRKNAKDNNQKSKGVYEDTEM